MRWQLIADHNEWPNPYTIIRRFLFELVGMIYHWIEITDKYNKFIICFARNYTWIYVKLKEYCNFGTKNSRLEWHVIPAQEVQLTTNKLVFHFRRNGRNQRIDFNEGDRGPVSCSMRRKILLIFQSNYVDAQSSPLSFFLLLFL